MRQSNFTINHLENILTSFNSISSSSVSELSCGSGDKSPHDEVEYEEEPPEDDNTEQHSASSDEEEFSLLVSHGVLVAEGSAVDARAELARESESPGVEDDHGSE